MNTSTKILIAIIGFLLIFLLFTPWGAKAVFNWDYSMKKAQDVSRYETRKNVEDTCRAMMSSYKADSLTWEQYKATNGETLSWANQAKMRANSTASSYNNYVLKNSFVFQNNIPEDILMNLPYLDK
jgi:hypothetical protein